MLRLICTLAAAVLLSGCAPQVQQMTQPYNDADYKAYAEPGDAALTGQAFLRQNGGGIVTCAGSTVFLVPDTPFTEEMISIAAAGRQPTKPTNFTGGTYGRQAFRQGQCDAQGNFTFDGLASGQWIVATDVIWMVGYARQGGGLMHRILLRPGQKAHVLLTDSDLL